MLMSLSIATVMVILTVVIHFLGLLFLIKFLNRSGRGFRPHESLIGQGVLIILVVLGLVFTHAIQIWVYAFLYLAIGALPDFETALYYSTTAFTTVGFGDVVLPQQWRLVGAIEAANGFMLFGWSIAFLMSMTGKLRSFEHDWLERQ
jgi:hypothetical protein